MLHTAMLRKLVQLCKFLLFFHITTQREAEFTSGFPNRGFDAYHVSL
jgi:hypothetical protein